MESSSLIDNVWILFCSTLVCTMQIGFLCLEAGLTRTKNSINVALKNVVDFGLMFIVFWFFGFSFAFGPSIYGLMGQVGSNDLLWSSLSSGTFFIFEFMFAVTSVAIISGSVAERVRFAAYMLVVLVVGLLIYPFVAHWAWNGLRSTPQGWLAIRGFVDFSGSAVVHVVGGAGGLALLLILGPRIGRYSAEGKVNRLPASNLPLAMAGLFLLVTGWLGFNGGSVFHLNSRVPAVMSNTIIAGSVAMLASIFFAYVFEKKWSVFSAMNGMLSGLVAVNAGVHAYSSINSIIVGVVAGILMELTHRILDRFQIDDAVGAIPVHLSGGIWGTLAVAILGDRAFLDSGLSHFAQFKVQLLGVSAIAVWSFGITYFIFCAVNKIFPLRVSDEQEKIGLNVVEHGEHNDLSTLLNSMQAHEKTGDIKQRVVEEPFTEVGEIARQYNRVIDALERVMSQLAISTRFAVIGEISGNIAHEVNNPLGVLHARSVLLRNHLENPQVDKTFVKDCLDNIDRTVTRISRIIRGIEFLGSQEKDSIKETDIESILNEAQELSGQDFARSEVRLKLEIEQKCRLKCRATLLAQVFANLIRNSCDVLLNQHDKWIKIKVTKKNEFLNIEYTDSGPPAPRQEKAKWFEPYFTTKPRGGNGLGLYLSKKIIENHSGTIELDLDSSVTRFLISLPCAQSLVNSK